MIPLRLVISEMEVEQPFVVKIVSSRSPGLPEEFTACLENEAPEGAMYWTNLGKLVVHNIRHTEIEDDVLLVIPRSKIAHRLVRARSPDNTFLVTERCDQLCQMCSQPPKHHHVNLFLRFQEAALLAPEGSTIGLSGGEPLLFKPQIFELLNSCRARRKDLKFHILTNGQHFEPADSAFLREFQDSVLWGIPLYSSEPDEHDYIVGKEGAFERLLHSLKILCRSGAHIELRTIVMNTNYHRLSELANFVTVHLPFVSTWALMQLESIGFARKNWKSIFRDTSLDFTLLGDAINLSRAHGIDTQLYNFPLCTVPAEYRSITFATISDWKRRYLPVCESCPAKSTCGGFFEWYRPETGFARLGWQ
jgi:His-Xaa-Ser system radical SAM maturase HxsC